MANDTGRTELYYQIKTMIERSEKRKTINTLVSWKLTPSKRGDKIKRNSILGEQEIYLIQN